MEEQLTEAWANLRKLQNAKQNIVDHKAKLGREIQDRTTKTEKAKEDISAMDVEIAATQAEIDALQKAERQARITGSNTTQEAAAELPPSIVALEALAEKLGNTNGGNDKAKELQQQCGSIASQWNTLSQALATVSSQCEALLAAAAEEKGKTREPRQRNASSE